VIRLLRAALDAVAPHVALVTETNVPHGENVSYFGDGEGEAQMVYNFALPPLVLHTFLTGDVTRLVGWARELEPPSDTTHFLNFLASHDGIGLMGARGILEPLEIDALCDAALERGGLVSMRSDPDAGESPYELNITWFSALNPTEPVEPVRLQVDRFIASRAVALVLRGVPGIYLLSLFGRQNDLGAVLGSDSRRAINRSAVDEALLLQLLADERGSTRMIWDRFMHLLAVRREWRAFHPRSRQEVLEVGSEVFAVARVPDEGEVLLCLINVTDRAASVDLQGTGWRLASGARDLLEHGSVAGSGSGAGSDDDSGAARAAGTRLELAPYRVAWYAGVEPEGEAPDASPR
jgi:sucrose phosphorylase